MNNNLETVTVNGVIPVIKIEALEHALPLANALIKGGIHTIEVTVRNEIAFDAIYAIRTAYPDMPVIPGCVTATEIGWAYQMGLRVVKFFPAETNGGITWDNLGKYLREEVVAACGGSFMASADLIREGKWEQITENCRRAVSISQGFR